MSPVNPLIIIMLSGATFAAPTSGPISSDESTNASTNASTIGGQRRPTSTA